MRSAQGLIAKDMEVHTKLTEQMAETAMKNDGATACRERAAEVAQDLTDELQSANERMNKLGRKRQLVKILEDEENDDADMLASPAPLTPGALQDIVQEMDDNDGPSKKCRRPDGNGGAKDDEVDPEVRAAAREKYRKWEQEMAKRALESFLMVGWPLDTQILLANAGRTFGGCKKSTFSGTF